MLQRGWAAAAGGGRDWAQMTAELAHRHGRHLHAHAHTGSHRHLLRPRRSQPPGRRAHGPKHAGRSQAHSHGLGAASIRRSRAGVRAVLLALAVLGATAAAQALVFVGSGSVALLADLIHNLGDASTAIPLGVAFALRSERAERWAGGAVVLAIFLSACVAGYEAVDRLLNPQEVEALVPLAAAGVLGFAGNWMAAMIRSRAGRRLDSAALIADGAHARADAYVSLAVVASAGSLAAGFQVVDPLIGLGITLVILRITWQSWRTVRHEHH
jgi:divalent metal cation (Fe/Co/Zn/Cd) transporter